MTDVHMLPLSFHPVYSLPPIVHVSKQQLHTDYIKQLENGV